MNKEEFIKAIKKLNIDVNEQKLEQLEIYYNLLIEYNSHTNVTAIIEKNDVYLKHFYDSLIISKYVNLKEINKLIDIGSGAGFPGIVLKIFYPNIYLTVLDSNNKKTKFIEQVVNKLNLINVTIINDRAEEYAKKHLNEFDLVTSRAVAYTDIITELSMPFVSLKGQICLMKGRNNIELEILSKYKKELNVKNFNINKYHLLNQSDDRHIVLITKDKLTNNVKSYSQIVKRSKTWNR